MEPRAVVSWGLMLVPCAMIRPLIVSEQIYIVKFWLVRFLTVIILNTLLNYPLSHMNSSKSGYAFSVFY